MSQEVHIDKGKDLDRFKHDGFSGRNLIYYSRFRETGSGFLFLCFHTLNDVRS